VGRNRRRRQRQARQAASSRAGWLSKLDAFGGPTVIVSVVVALAVVGVLIAMSRARGDDEPFEPLVRSEVSGNRAGAAGAPVRIIEFADFQCGACGSFAKDFEPAITAEFIETGIASLELVHFPFLGPESFAAAEACECAGDQGRFWEYHDLLFQRQRTPNSGGFSSGRLKDFGDEVADLFPDFDTKDFKD
jgi:protein-disulfide isomerase